MLSLWQIKVRDFSRASVTLQPAEFASWGDARSELILEGKRPMKAQLQAELAAAADDHAREEITAAFASREKALGKTCLRGLKEQDLNRLNLLTSCRLLPRVQSMTSTTSRWTCTSPSTCPTTYARAALPSTARPAHRRASLCSPSPLLVCAVPLEVSDLPSSTGRRGAASREGTRALRNLA